MKKMNKEQIVRALELCNAEGDDGCVICPYADVVNCYRENSKDALDLIKEFTDEHKRLLQCKVALFKMLDQFGWQTEFNGEHCICTLCESAGEWAFNALGLADDPITMEKFYTEYDKVWAELCHANGTEPAWSYFEFYKREQSSKPWKLSDVDKELDEAVDEDDD